MTLSPVLVRALRGAHVESEHRGRLAVVDADGRVLLAAGDIDARFFVRSTLKPVQALPFVTSGAWARYGADPAWLAIACGSHAGTPRHRALVFAMLEAAGLDLTALRCGAHEPYDADEARRLVREDQAPDAAHCNCSGKHAAMLLACREAGWPVEGYDLPDHPLQRAVKGALGALVGRPEAELEFAVDGCGVPTYRLSARELGLIFARLGTGRHLPGAVPAAAAEAIVAAMRQEPEAVSGAGRLDAALMRAPEAGLWAKSGGEAVHAGAWLERGLGWGLKIDDGGRRGIAPALGAMLDTLGHPAARADGLQTHFAPVVRNNRGEAVGALEGVRPEA